MANMKIFIWRYSYSTCYRFMNLTCPFEEYNSGWWFSNTTQCSGPKLTGEINPTTVEQGMYWPGFPDPFNSNIQLLSKVVVKILDKRLNETGMSLCTLLCVVLCVSRMNGHLELVHVVSCLNGVK